MIEDKAFFSLRPFVKTFGVAWASKDGKDRQCKDRLGISSGWLMAWSVTRTSLLAWPKRESLRSRSKHQLKVPRHHWDPASVPETVRADVQMYRSTNL